MRFKTTSEGSTTPLAEINKSITITVMSISTNNTIEKVGNNDTEINDFGIIDVNSIKSINIFISDKFKSLV